MLCKYTRIFILLYIIYTIYNIYIYSATLKIIVSPDCCAPSPWYPFSTTKVYEMMLHMAYNDLVLFIPPTSPNVAASVWSFIQSSENLSNWCHCMARFIINTLSAALLLIACISSSRFFLRLCFFESCLIIMVLTLGNFRAESEIKTSMKAGTVAKAYKPITVKVEEGEGFRG